jgi:hypothetical protein
MDDCLENKNHFHALQCPADMTSLLQKGHCTAKHAKVAKKKIESRIYFQDNLRESLTFLKRL